MQQFKAIVKLSDEMQRLKNRVTMANLHKSKVVLNDLLLGMKKKVLSAQNLVPVPGHTGSILDPAKVPLVSKNTSDACRIVDEAMRLADEVMC